MPKKDFEKLKTQGAVELAKSVAEAREKLWNMQRELNDGKLKNVRALQVVRREIARMLTLLQIKKTAEAKK